MEWSLHQNPRAKSSGSCQLGKQVGIQGDQHLETAWKLYIQYLQLLIHSLFIQLTQLLLSAYIMPGMGNEAIELGRPGPFSQNLLSREEMDNN